MNREEDVLFLFATSHGDSNGLGLTYPPRAVGLGDAELRPAELRRMLDEAGIKWRVLVISGCKSGVFVAALRDDSTLVATAAASDRLSSGCMDGAPFTSFGRAVFGEALPVDDSFLAGLEHAGRIIEEREKTGKLTASMPQLNVGKDIGLKLRTLEARLAKTRNRGAPSP